MSVSSADLDPNSGVSAESTSQVEAPVSTDAEPPAADQGSKTPATMLDAVKAAVGQTAGEQSPSSEGAEKDSDSTDPDAESAGEDDSDEFTDEETARLHSKTRRRVKKLVASNHALREEVESLRPSAEKMQRVDAFVQQSGLSYDEVNDGFSIMRLMKTDPAKAYEALVPFMQSLEEVLGKRLPADLHQQVAQGYTTRDIAAELARQRHAAVQSRQQVQATQQQVAQRDHRSMVENLTGAITQFESDWKKSDPDYATKQPRVTEKFELAMLKAIQSGNPPRTPKDAIALAEKCRDEVNQEIRRLVPSRPKELRPVTGGASAAAAPAPQNTLDVIRMAVGHR